MCIRVSLIKPGCMKFISSILLFRTEKFIVMRKFVHTCSFHPVRLNFIFIYFRDLSLFVMLNSFQHLFNIEFLLLTLLHLNSNTTLVRFRNKFGMTLSLCFKYFKMIELLMGGIDIILLIIFLFYI